MFLRFPVGAGLLCRLLILLCLAAKNSVSLAEGRDVPRVLRGVFDFWSGRVVGRFVQTATLFFLGGGGWNVFHISKVEA